MARPRKDTIDWCATYSRLKAAVVPEHTYTAQEAADLFGQPLSIIHSWLAAGHLRSTKKNPIAQHSPYQITGKQMLDFATAEMCKKNIVWPPVEKPAGEHAA